MCRRPSGSNLQEHVVPELPEEDIANFGVDQNAASRFAENSLCCPAFFNIFKHKDRSAKQAWSTHTRNITEGHSVAPGSGCFAGYVDTLPVTGSDRRGLNSPMRHELLPATPTQKHNQSYLEAHPQEWTARLLSQ